MITGLNHINLAVKDIDRSFKFYKDLLGFTPLCKSEGSAYFIVGDISNPNALWLSLDLDRQQKRTPSPCNSHMAFSVDKDAFLFMKKRLLDDGVICFKNNTSPGDSLYFYDPDEHKLEIHSGTWQDRIAAKKQNPGNWQHVEWFI